jgi:large subunit ribosomal protein L24e
MVERRVCTFCGDEIEPGTGKMYIKKDGVVYHFCKSKCFKNMIDLRRVPRRTTWTSYHEREKATRMKGLPVAPEARKVKKSEETAEPEASKEEAEGTKKVEPKGPEKEKPAPKAEKKPEPKPAKKAEAPKKDKPKASASEGASG